MSEPLVPAPWANDKADLTSELVMREIVGRAFNHPPGLPPSADFIGEHMRASCVLPFPRVLREEADEWENVCKQQPTHDICEGCEQAGLLRRAADEIERLEQELKDACSALNQAENQGKWRTDD